MHFEILVEDASGKDALDELVPKIVGKPHTFKVIPYKGVGKIPKGLKPQSNSKKRILLDQLPKLIQGYGKTFQGFGPDYNAALIVVCDLDDQCLSEFRRELLNLVEKCHARPAETRFCIAIKEGEAWHLGDLAAVKKAYPKAKEKVLDKYTAESSMGTWETLADAVFPGGSQALKNSTYREIGEKKAEWARKIAPHINVEENTSPSFQYFRETLRRLS
jgi:hypothetical protein